MPAKSKAQQRFMGMVHSYKKGDMKNAPSSVKKASKGMSKKTAKDFASTKHKGKPEHVDEVLREMVRREIRNALKEASNFRDKTDSYTNAMTSLDRYFLNIAAIPAPKKAKKVSKLINTLRKTFFSKDEASSINVEPNWKGLYRFMMHMKKSDNSTFVHVTRKMGSDWKKIVAMAEKNKWK